jgi:nicotinic acid mononucleotide adenylyltransferase
MPRIHVTGIEARLRTRYTADTLRALKRRCPGVRFVWIMGSDNLAEFPPLERVARDRPDDADRGHRPARLDP